MKVNEMSLSEHKEQLEAAVNTRGPPGAAICRERVQLLRHSYKSTFTEIYENLQKDRTASKIVRFQTGCTRL